MQQSFGDFLKEHLQKQALSIRQLSLLVDIDKSTISRIINGKRKPTMQHLDKLSHTLHIPYLELLARAGYPVDMNVQSDELSDLQFGISEIEQTLLASKQCKELFSMKKLHGILRDLRMYAQTQKGQQLIKQQFTEKLATVHGQGPFIDRLKKCFTIFTKQTASKYQLILLGSALLYFILNYS